MAGTTGLEPATSDVTGRRSNQLNYVPANTSRRYTNANTAGACTPNHARQMGARLESGGRRDSSAKRLESQRMPYARQGAVLWGSLVSCGRLAIGKLPRLHGIAAVANRRAGCQPA